MNPSNNGRKQFIVVRPTAQINSPRAATYIVVPSSPIRLQQISANNVNPVRLLGQMIVQPQQIGVRQILMTSPVSSSPAVGSPNGSINIRQISPLPRVTFTSRRAKKPLLSKVHAKSEETQEAKVACPNCGIAATNFQICRRCKKFVNTTPKPTLKITSSNKIIVDGINATMREIENKTRGIPSTSFYSNGKGESDFARYLRASEQGSSKAPVTRKRPLLTRVTKVPENDCITISSDSEDEVEPSNNSLSESSSTIGQPSQASGQTDADEETPTKRPKLEKEGEDQSQPSKLVPASPLPQSTVRTDEEISKYALNIFIDSIRIGQEKLTPQSVLRISQENINASAHSVTTKQGLILDIKWSNIDSCELCSDRREPCMYLKISHGSLPDLRETLGMEKGVNPYYDPNGPVEEKFFIIYFNSGFLNSSSQCSIDIIERKINLIRKKLKKPSTFFSKISYTESNYRQTVVAEIEAEESPASSQMEDTAKQSNEVSTSAVSQPITVLPHLRMVTRNQTSNVTKVTPISPVDDQLTFIFSGPRIELFVYPPPPAKGGISVTNEDQFCLNEGVFLNDKIIEFYLKYVYSRILSNEDQNRSHIFSCFFYERLMQKCKKVRDINAAERRHSQVKKWTRNIDIFSKDFIFIPINEASHWYLAVVCFPYLVHEIVEITRASGKKEILPLIACKAGDGFTAKSSKISSELAKVHTRGDKEQGSQQDYDQSEPRSESNSPVLERRRPMISVTLPNFTIRKKITKPHDVAKSNQNDDSSVDIANINSNNTCSHGDKESEHSSQEVLERTEDKDMHGTDKEDDHCDKHICKQQSQERGHLAILDSGSGYRSETKEIPLESGPVSCNETSNSDTSPSNCEVKHFSSPSKDVQKRQQIHDSVDVCVRTSRSNPEDSKSNVVESLGHTDSGNSDSKISGDDAEKRYKLYVDPGGIDFTLSKELKQQCTVSPIKPLVVLPKVKNVTPVKLKPETVIHNVPSSDESMILVSSPDCSDVDAKKLSKTVSPSGQLVECNSVVPATPVTPLILKLETSSHELSDCGDVSKRPFKKITPLYRAENVSSLGVDNEASSQLEEHKHRALSDPEDVTVSKKLFSPEKDFKVESVAQTSTTVSTVECGEENIPSNSESVVCPANSEEASDMDQNVENDNKSDAQAFDKPNMDTQTTPPSGSLESSESGDKDEKDSRNQKDEGDEDDRVIKRMYKRPCILVFDSLRGPSRSKIASSLREYLSMEWKTRKEKEFGLKTFDKDSLKMCSVVVPQQDNYTDCGVFLLHYVEKFFSNPIQSFSLPIKELENWFDPNECKNKREDIKKVIDDLHEDWLARTITEES